VKRPKARPSGTYSTPALEWTRAVGTIAGPWGAAVLTVLLGAWLLSRAAQPSPAMCTPRTSGAGGEGYEVGAR
jgi:hypothetical protein